LFIAAVSGSAAAQDALNAPGVKTVLAPSDAAIGSTEMTDTILLGHIFEGNFTAEALQALSQIVSINGEVYTVSVQTVATRGRRNVAIRISNNRSTTLLTALDVPTAAGPVHGTDSVLLPNDESSSSDKTAGQEWYEEGNGIVTWIIVAAAVLLVLVIAALVASRRGSKYTSNVRVDETGAWHDPPGDDFVLADNALSRLRASQTDLARPRHYYPAADPRDEQYLHAQLQPTHYYPSESMAAPRPASPVARPSGRQSSYRNSVRALNAAEPTLFSTRLGHSDRPVALESAWEYRRPRTGYVDPEPLQWPQ